MFGYKIVVHLSTQWELNVCIINFVRPRCSSYKTNKPGFELLTMQKWDTYYNTYRCYRLQTLYIVYIPFESYRLRLIEFTPREPFSCHWNCLHRCAFGGLVLLRTTESNPSDHRGHSGMRFSAMWGTHSTGMILAHNWRGHLQTPCQHGYSRLGYLHSCMHGLYP